MSPLDIAREIFPEKTDEVLEFIIWEKTGYPHFFRIPKDGATMEECLRNQLMKFKEELEKEK